MGKLFVWDLHGTLEKGNEELVLAISNEVLLRFGYARQMNWQEALYLSGKKWHEYFAHLLPDASMEECKVLETACVEVSRSDDRVEKQMRPNDYAIEVLERIEASGNEQIVISNTSTTGLKRFLAALGFERFFPAGYAFPVHEHTGIPRTKLDALREFAEGRKFSRKVAIGDSAHDLMGDINFLYAHPDRDHRECDVPHHKIRDLRAILREL